MVSNPPATGQHESPIPRYVGPDAGQWERWDLNAHLSGAAPITPQLAPGTTSFGGFNSNGRISATCIPTPAAPSVLQNGATGTTLLSYFLVCHDANGGVTPPSPATTIVNGNATLSAGNFVTISWPAIPGCASYDVLKTNTSTALALGVTALSVSDTGQATTPYQATSRNSTCDVAGNVNGAINVQTYNAKGDMRQVSDGVLTSGSTTFTSATAGFTQADVGKLVTVMQSAPFSATIASVTNSTTAVLSGAPSQSQTALNASIGTDNCAAITNALAAAPLNISNETGAQVYFPPGIYLTSCGFNPARGSSSGNGLWLNGAGPYVSRIVGANTLTSAIIAFNNLSGNPSAITNLGVTAAIGSMPNADCVDLVGDNAVFLNHDWFQGCKYDVYLNNTTGFWAAQNTAEIGLNAIWYITGQSDGRITGNEMFDGFNNSGATDFDFENVSNSGDRFLLDDNDDLNTALGPGSHAAYTIKINGSNGIDFGTFQFKGGSPVTTAAVLITNSYDISIAPKFKVNGTPIGLSIDASSHDVTIDSPDFANVTTPISAAIGAYNVSVVGVHAHPNMAQDSDNFRSWTLGSSSLVVSPGLGPSGETAVSYTGTGSASGGIAATGLQQPVDASQQGQVVSFGGYIDATYATAGGPMQIGLNTNLSNTVAACAVPNGSKGRCWATYTLPAGVTWVSISVGPNNATVTSGKKALFSAPKIEIGPYQTSYVPGQLATMSNACASTATLSSGAATVSNACITTNSHCTANDQTAPNAVQVAAPSAGSLTLHGTGSDVVTWACQ